MQLLTKELRKEFSKLGNLSDKKVEEIQIVVKFFDPTGSWTWYAYEGEPRLDENEKEIDFIFFGFVRGLENELGTFSLSELQSIKGPFGLGIERDLYFGKHTLDECMEKRI